MPEVSVVMLSFNRKDDVLEGVSHLLNQAFKSIEILIVDNASTDGTVDAVQKAFSEVRVIPLKENIGVAAYNIGFQEAVSEFIVILDDDSFPEHHALTRMVSEFRQDPLLGVVAFDVRHYQEFKRGLIDSSRYEDNKAPRYQMAFNGCGVGIRKKIIQQVGGYPEEFFLYWNEQDLAIRILDSGYHIRAYTDIIAFHKYSPSNRQSWRAPFFYTRNLYWLIWKYFPPSRLLKDTFQLFFYCCYYSLEQFSPIYIKAALSALCGISSITRKPAKKSIIKNLRLTYKLAFIYFR